MSRVIAAASSAGATTEAESAIARELGAFTGLPTSLLLPVDERSTELHQVTAIADALTAELAIRLEGAEARRLTAAVGVGPAPAALLLPMRAPNQNYVLVLAGGGGRELTVGGGEGAAAPLAPGATSLGQGARLERRAREGR